MINNLRYADDTVIIAESKHQLQQLMDTVVDEGEAKGLFDIFVYLGSLFTSDGRCGQDVRQRIAIAKSAFTSLEKVLKNRNINIQLRCIFLKCYV